MSLVRWVIWLAVVSLRQAPSSGPAEAPPAVHFSAEQINSLIADLSSPRYNVREDATKSLCQLRDTDLPLLVEKYKNEHGYEPKRRIRYIVEFIFHRDQILGRNGFMGVQVYPMQITDLVDPESGRTTRGVAVQNVKHGFNAERAGLKNTDLIVAVDGEPLPDDPSMLTNAFVNLVSGHAPGTKIRLRLLRPSESRQVTLKASNAPSKLLEGLRLGMVSPGPSDAPAPPLAIVTRIQAGSAAAAAGLDRYDYVKRINGAPIGIVGGNTPEALFSTVQPNSDVVLDIARSKLMTIEVTLGTRPPEYINPKDVVEARNRFMHWWQDQGGDLPPRASAESGPRVAWIGTRPPRLNRETSLLP